MCKHESTVSLNSSVRFNGNTCAAKSSRKERAFQRDLMALIQWVVNTHTQTQTEYTTVCSC